MMMQMNLLQGDNGIIIVYGKLKISMNLTGNNIRWSHFSNRSFKFQV